MYAAMLLRNTRSANLHEIESRIVGFERRYTHIYVHPRLEEETTAFFPR